MKRNILIFLFIFLLISPVQGNAQNEISVIESLSIELWPDYDRSSVLVLLTGTLPAGTRFPATVIIPLPEKAQLNAVARIDSRDGIMKSDISSAPGPSNMLMFITTDLKFRVEYYIPYIVNGKQRLFDYSWLAEIDVNNIQLKIQQPKMATSFNVRPAAMDTKTDIDGLTYHTFSPKAILAGQLLSVHLEYEMINAQLSVNTLPPPRTESQVQQNFPSSATESFTNWPFLIMIVGGLFILIGFLWLISSRRNQMDPQSRPQNRPQAKFCHDCGEPVDETDKWCAQCGTYL